MPIVDMLPGISYQGMKIIARVLKYQVAASLFTFQFTDQQTKIES